MVEIGSACVVFLHLLRLFGRGKLFTDLALRGGLNGAHDVVMFDETRSPDIFGDVNLRTDTQVLDVGTWTSQLCLRLLFNQRLLLQPLL